MKCTILKIRTVAEWWRFSLQFLWRKHSIFCKRLIYRCDTHPFVCSMSRQFFRFQFSLIYFLTYVKGSITAWAWARTRIETTFFPLHTHTLTMWPSANAFLLNILFIYLFLDFSFFSCCFFSVWVLCMLWTEPDIVSCGWKYMKSLCCQQMVWIPLVYRNPSN